ncbi:MBL fold metallo-hydrolase [Aphanothece sacrum]|uniref:Metallo-beta-lactamase domain-containing protein n=1 Tax=Aphanothece sacrum FPU1 TaxID=1920663 RepID=A0A401IMT7_APHSA|nr:MBL fold metallo-hydrolase [Aphanothece sacrum]GBF82563.1 hypothetical protein AsFPU1_3993 [Aphanothece sacrum FPU1]GBF84697.1 hypothetical protein AsFPU3_1751 [Aphanothece sacrum FPU3]
MDQRNTRTPKPPRLLLDGLFAFPPNRETLGGTAYFIVEKPGNILLDCPIWDEETQQFLKEQGGVKSLLLTHRGAITPSVKSLQAALGSEILIQEQEAYLLPDVPLTPFEQEITLISNLTAIWTPGHSPGSCCAYWQRHEGVLFTGRHLLPSTQGEPTPLRLAKTFHWFRQLDSVALLRDRFSSDTLNYICPGANTGFLRGKGLINDAYHKLKALDLLSLRQHPISL